MTKVLAKLGTPPQRRITTPTDETIAAARHIEIADAPRCEAASAYDAACWLLTVRYSHFCRGFDASVPLLFPLDAGEVLGFRGQHARYDTLLPTICRLDHSKKRVNQDAWLWYRVACQEFHDRCFQYLKPPVGSARYWFGIDETTPVAEHYGIGTNLINWSWDPLVALVFAIRGLSEGESGMVLIRRIDPCHDAELVLAPSFAKRVWLQRGFFQELACPGEGTSVEALMPLLIGSSTARSLGDFHHITFPCSAADILWAEDSYRQLLLSEDPLLALADWALQLAVGGPPESRVLWHAGDWPYLEEELGKRNLTPPPFGETECKEDLTLMVDYIDSVALRDRDGDLGYDMGALAYISKRLPAECTARNRDYGEASGSGRLKTLTRLLAMNPRFLEAIKDQAPFAPIEHGVQ